VDLKTQPNEARCTRTTQTHELDLPPCCPRSGNPLAGSSIAITYTPAETHIEVASLRKYVDSYQGGRGSIRSMEGMIQQIARDCSEAVGVPVTVTARLVINPGQRMTLTCDHSPATT